MEQKRRAPTPGAVGDMGAPSIAVLGDGPVRDLVLARYMVGYYQWMDEEASE